MLEGMTLASDDKVLILFRHAKAEQVPGKPDHERELTGRGRSDARAAGAWLHEHELGRRARALLDGDAHPPDLGRRRGGGSLRRDGRVRRRALLRRRARPCCRSVRESAGEAQVVLVVGHNPTMAMLASGLTEGDGSTAAHECLAAGFPTSSLAVLRYSGPVAGPRLRHGRAGAVPRLARLRRRGIRASVRSRGETGVPPCGHGS